jgi:hypothetical protein
VQRSQQFQEAAATKLRTMTLPALGQSASTPSPAPVTAATQVLTSSGPAPVAPATPSAAPAPAVVTATSAPQPAARTVTSGERQRVGFFYYLNPDCTFGGYMVVRIITPPVHGELSTERGVDYTSFPKENQRYQCNLKQSPGIYVYYKSNSGYLGTDSTLIEAASPIGTTFTRTYTITVR